MQTLAIYDFKSHQKYLHFRLNAGSASRGEKTRLAKHLGVQASFVSQILNEKLCLSLEQAELTNAFLNHSLEESDFFILLTNRDRAGSRALRLRFDQQISSIRARRQEVVERIGKKTELSPQAQSIYYSSWLYPAVHVAATVSSLRPLDKLANYLNIEREKLLEIVEFLQKSGLVLLNAGQIQPTQNWVRLDRSSPFVSQMHRNWRDVSIRHLEKATAQDLHFSGIYSTDAKTAQAFKDLLLDQLKIGLKDIEKSKEEDLYVLGLDFFQLKTKPVSGV